MNKNKFACIMQQDHCMILFTETCKLILKINCFTDIFEIGYIPLQCMLTGPDATQPQILQYHKYHGYSTNFRNSFRESKGEELFLKSKAKKPRSSLQFHSLFNTVSPYKNTGQKKLILIVAVHNRPGPLGRCEIKTSEFF